MAQVAYFEGGMYIHVPSPAWGLVQHADRWGRFFWVGSQLEELTTWNGLLTKFLGTISTKEWGYDSHGNISSMAYHSTRWTWENLLETRSFALKNLGVFWISATCAIIHFSVWRWQRCDFSSPEVNAPGHGFPLLQDRLGYCSASWGKKVDERRRVKRPIVCLLWRPSWGNARPDISPWKHKLRLRAVARPQYRFHGNIIVFSHCFSAYFCHLHPIVGSPILLLLDPIQSHRV